MRRDAMRCDARTGCTKQGDAADKDVLVCPDAHYAMSNSFLRDRAIIALTHDVAPGDCLRYGLTRSLFIFSQIFTTRLQLFVFQLFCIVQFFSFL